MPIILTEKELCDLLKVERKFIFACRKNGMPYLKLGSRLIRYEMDIVIEWLKENSKEICKNG
jgi:hypothetical protein